MKRFILLSMLVGFSAATPTLSIAQADDATATGAVDAATARAEIQKATDELNAALKRGDAVGALKWLAPDFELDRRQYLVQNLDWMKKVLPLQLERGQFSKLTVTVESVNLRDDLADVKESLDIETQWKPGVAKIGARKSSGYGLEGNGEANWRRTPDGWRLIKGNAALKSLWYLAPLVPPIAAQPAVKAESPATAAGLTLQEPVTVFEVQAGQNDNSLAFSPDSTQLAWIYSATNLRFGALPTGAVTGEKAASRLFYQLAFDKSGALWTSDSDGIMRRWSADGKTLLHKWEVAREFANYRYSVAPNGQQFAVFGNSNVKLWSAEQGEDATFKPAFGEIRNIEYSPDSSLMAVFSYTAIEVRDAKDGHLVHAFTNELWAGFLDDGQTMVTVATNANPKLSTYYIVNSALRFRSVKTGEIERETPIPNLDKPDRKALNGATIPGEANYYTVQRPLISPDGKVALGVYEHGESGYIGVWNAQSGQLMRMLRGFSYNMSTVHFSPDSQRVAISSSSGEIAVWDVSLSQPQLQTRPQLEPQPEPQPQPEVY